MGTSQEGHQNSSQEFSSQEKGDTLPLSNTVLAFQV